MASPPTSNRPRRAARHPSIRTHAAWLLMTMLGLGACDPESLARIPTRPDRSGRGDGDSDTRRPRPEPEPKGSTSSDDEVCTEDEPDWYGCPGNPCAHGWCFVGECVGVVVGDDGMLVDPGVCCVDEECLEPSR